jgi:cell division transport system ATP-binding protein
MISFSQVAKRYPGSGDVLNRISFSIDQGEAVLLTGPSGAGKTTLLKLIAAIERPSQGSILVHGQNISQLRPAQVPYLRRKLGLVFQDHKLLFDRNVFDNVLLPLQIAGTPHQESVRRVRAALDKVGLLGKERVMPIALSGGEQQRVCIARAIVNRPAILLADEPTGHLDAAYAREILELFQAFNQVGVTLVLSTHDEQLIGHFTGRRLHLQQGALLETASSGSMTAATSPFPGTFHGEHHDRLARTASTDL